MGREVGGIGREAIEYVFRQLIVKLSNNYINFLDCLVPNAKDKAKKRAIKRKKKVAVISVHKTPAWCL